MTNMSKNVKLSNKNPECEGQLEFTKESVNTMTKTSEFDKDDIPITLKEMNDLISDSEEAIIDTEIYLQENTKEVIEYAAKRFR
jgi:hypothetical protein